MDRLQQWGQAIAAGRQTHASVSEERRFTAAFRTFGRAQTDVGRAWLQPCRTEHPNECRALAPEVGGAETKYEIWEGMAFKRARGSAVLWEATLPVPQPIVREPKRSDRDPQPEGRYMDSPARECRVGEANDLLRGRKAEQGLDFSACGSPAQKPGKNRRTIMIFLAKLGIGAIVRCSLPARPLERGLHSRASSRSRRMARIST
jgi:hypothetical protein